jgi:leucine zipper transcription factor-like protein 1
MASDFGLNDSHEEQIVNFLRFSRLKRGEATKAIENAFQGVVDSRLVEETYTVDEVKDILSSLEGVTRADVESELIYSSHTSVLVLKQACEQAEKWHLKLNPNISELENREQIQKVARFEALKFSDDLKSSSSVLGGRRLEPLNESGGSALLQLEIDRLKEDNKRLSSRLSQAETTVKDAIAKKDKLQKQLQEIQQSTTPQETAGESDELTRLHQEVSDLKAELSATKSTPVVLDTGKLERELEMRCQELLKVNAELETVKSEMDKKFNETSQFVNMKKMLSSKNDQIKQLRDRLKRYEPDGQ